MSAVKPPKPPVGLAATAWVAPTVQYLNDTAGTVFTFSIRNTGTLGIGAVEVARPSSSWVVTACPLAPAGWSTQRSDNFCRYRSASGSADDLAPGSLTSTFQLRATTAAGTADRTGTWSIHVSSSSSFDDPSALKPAPPEAPGLTIIAFSFQITDAQVGTGTSGAACPAPTAANHSAITGSTQTILICGRNRMSAAATPTAARSSLAGTFIASPGTFSSASIPANSANVILGKWTGATITSTSGPGKSIITKTGSAVNRNSPLTTLDDVCGASPAFETCIANGGYEALNEPPDAVDDTANANEDGPAVPIDVLANDSDPDGDPITVTSTGGSPQGLVSITGGGTGISYDPNGQFESLAAGETDTDTFTYTIQDPFLASDTATVTVTITGQNDPPTAGDDVATVAEDSTGATIDVLANDTDPDATDALAVTAVDTTGTTGTVTNNGTDVTYDPNGQFDGLAAGATATDTFTYTASDGNGGTDTATVTVTITGANDPPVANDDLAGANEGGPAILVNVLANDTDPDADTLAINSIDTTGTVGSVTNNGTDVTYNPNGQFESLGAGETANDTFTYTVADGHGGTDTATVTVTITGVNDPPTAVDDAADVSQDSTGTTIDVLANDTDPESDTLAVTAVDTTGTVGSVTNNGTDVTYDPNGQFDGLAAGETATDTFTYTISDGNGGTDTATVTVTITGANDPPVANDDVGSTDEDTQLNVAAPGVLANDTDPDGDTLAPTEMNGSPAAIGVATAIPSGALVTLNANGSYSYDPNGAFDALASGNTDTDSFAYTVSDGNGGSDTATVTITIHGVNDPPTAVDDTASTPEYADVTIDVLANDTDDDTTDVLAVTAVDTTGTVGSVTNNGTDVTYDPNGQFDALGDGETATDTFTYTVSDGHGGTDTATVTVTIIGSTNQPPTAVDDIASVGEDSTGDSIDVLANDTDPNSDTLTVAAVDTTGTVGSVTNNGTDVTYDPNGQFESLGVGDSDTDTFTYTVSDGNGGTDTATVTVTITGVNDPPVANDDVASTDEDTQLSIAAPGVLANDTDPDGDTLAPTEMNGSPAAIGVATPIPSGALVTLNANGSYSYNPNGAFDALAPGNTDTDSFSYTVSDGNGGSDTATVTITIHGVNDAPVGTNDSYANAVLNTQVVVGQSAPSTPSVSYTGSVLDNDTDIDDVESSLTATAATVASADGGSATIATNGTFTYTPPVADNDPGGADTSDTFTYTVSDTHGASGTGTVTITFQNQVVWYVMAGGAAGDGRSHNPFNSLAALTTAGGSDGRDGVGDIVFVYQGTGDTTGGLVLEGSQKLYGQPHGLVVGAHTLVAAGGSNPNITGGVVLANSGQILAVNLGNAATSSLSGSGTTVTVGGSSPDTVGVNNGTGKAIDVSATTGSLTFTSVTSAGSATEGIKLTNVGATFSAPAGSITTAAGNDVDIDGGTGNFDYNGTITNSAGRSVEVTNRSAGAANNVSFGGAISDTGTGINLDNNDVATINFSGGLTLSTGANAAFTAVNGGIVNVTGVNTATTTTGTAVNIANTTIGASHVTFRSVNVDGSDAAPVNGILISHTGSTGSFAVTGTGSAGTGGTIQDTSGNGIELVGTLSPSLDQMTVTSNLGNGIHGGNGAAGGVVTNATLQNLVVSNNGNDSGAEDGILFQGLVGTATFSNLNVSGSARHNVAVINNTGTLTSLTVSGSNIHDNAATSSNGLVFIADGTATMTASVGTTNFTTNRVVGVLSQTLSAGTLTVSVTGGTFTNNFVAVEFTHASTGSLTGTFTGATITNAINGCSGSGSPCGAPVNLFLGTNSGSAAGSILRATITNNIINNGGSGNAPGIWMHTGTPIRGHARLLITGNTITNINERGVAVEGGGCISPAICDGTVDATVENNTITLGAGALDGVHFNVGTAGTAAGNNDTLAYCGDIENNTLASAGGDAIRLRHRSLTTIRLPGYGGSAFDTAAVIAYLDARNPATVDTITAATSSAGGGYVNATCATP